MSISLSEYRLELRYSLGPTSFTILTHSAAIEKDTWYEVRVVLYEEEDFLLFWGW